MADNHGPGGRFPSHGPQFPRLRSLFDCPQYPPSSTSPYPLQRSRPEFRHSGGRPQGPSGHYLPSRGRPPQAFSGSPNQRLRGPPSRFTHSIGQSPPRRPNYIQSPRTSSPASSPSVEKHERERSPDRMQRARATLLPTPSYESLRFQNTPAASASGPQHDKYSQPARIESCSLPQSAHSRPLPSFCQSDFSQPPPEFSCAPPSMAHPQLVKFGSGPPSNGRDMMGKSLAHSSASFSQPPLPEDPPPVKPPPPMSPPTVFLPPPAGLHMWMPQGAFRPEWIGPPTVVFARAPPGCRPPIRFIRPHSYPLSTVARRDGSVMPPKQCTKRKLEAIEGDESKTVVRESKKKSMGQVYPVKPWNQQDAEKALAAEKLVSKGDARTLVVKFPDKDITREMVTALHPGIEKVHFQIPGTARYCYVKVKEDVDAEAVMEELNKTDFLNMGNLSVESKPDRVGNEDPLITESIDPYTLYLGNLPMNVNAQIVKEKFPTASRIDIGFAQRMKYTRYAFIRYQTVEDAIDGFHAASKLSFDSRSLIVRFRRQKAHVAPPNLPEQKVSKKLRRQRKKLLEKKEQFEELKKVISEKVKKEDPDEKKYKPQMAEFLKDEDLFDDGRLSDDNDEDDDIIDEDEDDDDDVIPPHVNGLLQSTPQLADYDDEEEEVEEEEDEDDDDDIDQAAPSTPPCPIVKQEKIKVEKNIKQEKVVEVAKSKEKVILAPVPKCVKGQTITNNDDDDDDDDDDFEDSGDDD